MAARHAASTTSSAQSRRASPAKTSAAAAFAACGRTSGDTTSMPHLVTFSQGDSLTVARS
eukprot:CAMPEP_0184130228 /NCGR_PEP_ID=MMETSP0974-20121125/27492_1 /TAXON_ID=483370 /ORGANISM="non described non described, Strain CCMP2097" /LENGTH=59 /DNA_ID=CAMNT_0026433685 /DNA_START=18 /DNA_END=194 /DNA_ORIENTATION=+